MVCKAVLILKPSGFLAGSCIRRNKDFRNNCGSHFPNYKSVKLNSQIKFSYIWFCRPRLSKLCRKIHSHAVITEHAVSLPANMTFTQHQMHKYRNTDSQESDCWRFSSEANPTNMTPCFAVWQACEHAKGVQSRAGDVDETEWCVEKKGFERNEIGRES
jgi:hypothetical protein